MEKFKLFYFAFCLTCIISYNTNGAIQKLTSNVLISSTKIYPSYIKTPQDIEDWLIKEGFKYKKDETREDEWKSPEKTIKDKTLDCEDLAVLVAYILKDLDYKNIMLIAIYGDSLAHGICWFQDKDDSWNFFSTGLDEKGNSIFYYNCKATNPFEILDFYFSEWTHIKLCISSGYSVKTFYRKDIEKGVAK